MYEISLLKYWFILLKGILLHTHWIGGMITGKGKLKCLQNLPQFYSVHYKHHMDYSGNEPRPMWYIAYEYPTTSAMSQTVL